MRPNRWRWLAAGSTLGIGVAIVATVGSASLERIGQPKASSNSSAPTAAPAGTLRPATGDTWLNVASPFDFCARVGTGDTFQNGNLRYIGPNFPFRQPTGAVLAWRCWEGKVLACKPAASIYPCGKVETGREPSPKLGAFCAQNPNELPPAAATGCMTAYLWACQRGVAVISSRWIPPSQIDGLGYLLGPWLVMPRPTGAAIRMRPEF